MGNNSRRRTTTHGRPAAITIATTLLLLAVAAGSTSDDARASCRPAKLYFRHGAVSSAKTLGLLAVAHTYDTQGKRVVVLKPDIDVRFGREQVASRAGLSRAADLLVTPTSELRTADFADVSCILVDEAQFLSAHVVEQLRDIATSGVPVICYGLRTDFRCRCFEGSKRLLELADNIEEALAIIAAAASSNEHDCDRALAACDRLRLPLPPATKLSKAHQVEATALCSQVKTTCAFCGRKAVFNLKQVNGVATVEGPQVALGCEEMYLPVCAKHYAALLAGAAPGPV